MPYTKYYVMRRNIYDEDEPPTYVMSYYSFDDASIRFEPDRLDPNYKYYIQEVQEWA